MLALNSLHCPIWAFHTPRVTYPHEVRFIAGYRVGRARRYVYARSVQSRERRAISRMLAAYGRA